MSVAEVFQKKDKFVILYNNNAKDKDYENNKVTLEKTGYVHKSTYCESSLKLLRSMDISLDDILHLKIKDLKSEFIETVVTSVGNDCTDIVFLLNPYKNDYTVGCRRQDDNPEEYKCKIKEFEKNGYVVVFSLNQDEIRAVRFLSSEGLNSRAICYEICKDKKITNFV